jgi:hypothetical protein
MNARLARDSLIRNPLQVNRSLISMGVKGFSIRISNFNENLRSDRVSIFKNPTRDFGSRGRSRASKKQPSEPRDKKTKFVKPVDVGAFSPTVEPLLQLENGYYLLYYHRQKKYTMFLLYLRFIIPIVALIYLIKKNPFYKSYPIMLPLMVIVLMTYFYKCMRYSAKTNRMVHQILIDPSGTEVTFIYKNRFARKLRNDNLEDTVLVQSLVNPPQGAEYTPLKGQLFPEEYPFRFEKLGDYNYFWLKYYISQNMLFALAKRPNYVNYEVLCNVFATRSIDFSQAKVYKFFTTKMSRFQLELVLDTLNPYSRLNFFNRMERAQGLQKLIHEYNIEEQPKEESVKKNKTYERIMNESKPKVTNQ